MVRRRARKAARLARAQVQGGALVLVYHRISVPGENPGGDPFRLCVSPASFEAQIAALEDLGAPVPLSELADRLRTGRSVRGLVCVTFDDGYVDNLETAAPILTRFGVPATFFIVTGMMGRPFWWDRLTGLVDGLAEIPAAGRLRLDGLHWTFEIADLSRQTRADLLTGLYALLKSRSDEVRDRSLDELARQAGVDAPVASRSMTWDELGQLLSNGLFAAGGHSLTHPQLASLDEPSQRAEIADCRARLTDFVGRPVNHFAYPFGARQDVSQRTMEIAREAGIEIACGTELDVVRHSSDPLRLPRFWVSDWSAERFASRVRRWFRPGGVG